MIRLRVPGDKSLTQRALILAALAEGESSLEGLLSGADPQSTAGALRALGADVPPPPADGSMITVRGVGLRGMVGSTEPLDFGNSGTGARLMLGVLAGQSMAATLTGDASLRSRPMRRVTDPLAEMGAGFEWKAEPDRLPVTVRGGSLRALEYDSPVASAQVKSALLLAGLVGGVGVRVTEPRRSRDHTERLLNMLGASVASRADGDRWSVELTAPPGTLRPLLMRIPGDPSSAAFLVALAALGGFEGPVTISEVGLNPSRTAFLEVFRRMGVPVEETDLRGEVPWEPVGDVTARRAENLRAVTIGPSEVPGIIDEIPILAALAARAAGRTRITGAGELRVKETDRIRALVTNLHAVGVQAQELEDGLEIEGSDRPLSGRVRAFHDHRIAMAFGVLGALPGNEIEVDDRAVADVSFPGFWSLIEGTDPRRGSGTNAGARAPAGPVVTLDGPAGSGKSTTAREVARRLGFRHLDSGALYRALACALLGAQIPESEWESLTSKELDRLGIHLEPREGEVAIFLGAQRLGPELRTQEVTAVVSTVASLPAVRSWLLDAQRRVGRAGKLVADGRDMGSVVFPDAEVKIFLVADLRERARRRLLQDGSSEPTDAEVTAEAERIGRRDRMDSEREHSPLVRPEGARELDTTGLDFQEQVEEIVRRIREL